MRAPRCWGLCSIGRQAQEPLGGWAPALEGRLALAYQRGHSPEALKGLAWGGGWWWGGAAPPTASSVVHPGGTPSCPSGGALPRKWALGLLRLAACLLRLSPGLASPPSWAGSPGLRPDLARGPQGPCPLAAP